MFHLELPLDRESGEPLSAQLVRALRAAVIEGRLPEGSRLPSSRALATAHSIARNTVLAAFDQLTAEGFISAKAGAGSRVCSGATGTQATPGDPPERTPQLSSYASRALALVPHARAPAPVTRRLDLDYGRPLVLPAMQSAWRRSLLRAADDTAFEYPPVAGLLRLRTALAGYLLRRRGLQVDPDDIVIVNGTQQGIELTARLLLDPGQHALVEDPCYQGLRQSLLAQGAKVSGIAVDAEGLVVSELQNRHARLLAVTPSHQFPSGAACSLGRRSAILQWAEHQGAYIIEDDYDGEFRHGGRPLAALKSLDRHGRVIYLGSLSKVLFPALRLGFLVVPRALREAYRAAKWLADRGCAAIEQQGLSGLIESGQFERLLLRSSRHLDERRRALLDAIARHLGTRVRVVGEQAGMHVCVWIASCPSSQESALIDRAAGLGVSLYGINRYYERPPAEVGLLVGYAHLSPGELDEAVRRLAVAINRT